MTDRPPEFDARVLQWMPLLRKMAYRFERIAQDREDLVNATVEVALRRWESFRDGGCFSGWLIFQMRSVLGEQRVKTKVRKRILTKFGATHEAQLFDGWSVSPASQELAVELAQVTDAFPPRYRELMTKIAIGYEQQEIADEEGVTRQAVQARVHNCRQKMWKVAA